MKATDRSEAGASRFYSHPLMGVSLSNLFRLFRMYGWPEKGHRGTALMFVLSALARLPFALLDAAYVAMKRNGVKPDPVFIIGHWRSGTTHLYNIMSKSPRFHFVSPFATALPQAFLVLTRLFRPLLVKTLPEGRFIDGVPVTEDSPQEDEIALSNLTANSFFHALYFPKDFYQTYNRGLFFDGVPKDQVAEWGGRLKEFYLKLQIEGADRRLLIKNPVYTARVKEILKLYPKARFIHIHRNPYKIFFSMRNFYQKLLAEFPLQNYEIENLDDHILGVYTRMMDNFERDAAGLPKGQLIEVRFEDLQKNPLKELEKIYRALDLGDFTEDKEAYTKYLEEVKDYRKNVYNFPEEDLKKVEIHWRRFIKRGGYSRP
ncbi:MAG: sulfotransferase [Proteobacteria bacterium]|nr:sulfotransferase [Pseudomonadota bacterium]